MYSRLFYKLCMRFIFSLFLFLSISTMSFSRSLASDLSERNHRIDNPVIQKIKENIAQKRKLIAAGLACPVPFGILGLHRIYLGTRPFVPLVYIGTLGGCLGILPLIDMVVILIEKDTERFDQNSRIFMWMEKKKE